MNQFQIIEKKVLKKITPKKQDKLHLKKTIQTLQHAIKKEIISHQINASLELVGSIAKDTYLKNNLDIDLFIIFPITIPEETITQTTLSIGRTILTNTEECYAEHPYIRGIFSSYPVELVPCYQITDATQKISAVDRTPLHTIYVKKNLKEFQKREVRLFKQFLRGIECYGAEAEIQGFSGYLCELLILRFKSFQNLINHASNWKKGKKISLTSNHIPNFEDSLIFIDPVDKERNVAAAVAPKTFQRFIIACQDYLTHPKITFFFSNPAIPWSLEKIEQTINKQQYAYIGIHFQKPGIINENLYPQIRKACRSITQASTEEGFTIYDTSFHIDTKTDIIYLIIKTDNIPLSETYVHQGPPTHLEKHTKEFIEKWQNHPAAVSPPFQQNNRTYVKLKRPYRYLSDFLNDNLTKLSLGRHLGSIIKKEYSIVDQNDLIIPQLTLFWTTYLDNKKPWER